MNNTDHLVQKDLELNRKLLLVY